MAAAKVAVREPVTLDGTTLALVPTPGRRKAQLNKLEGVRREMARIFRAAEAGTRDTADASKLIFMLAQIGKLLELTEIERRLTAIEDRTRG